LVAVVLALFLPIPRSRTRASASAERRPAPPIFRDDDRYWYAGIFYINPDDPMVFVPRRHGFGWTVNFGHPKGRLFMFGILLLVLVCGVVLPVLVSAAGLTPVGCHPSGCHAFP
jgi:uncharacterized membrane protein